MQEIRTLRWDVAGVGNGITERSKRARRWKRRIRPRRFLRIYAPALDPTAVASLTVRLPV